MVTNIPHNMGIHIHINITRKTNITVGIHGNNDINKTIDIYIRIYVSIHGNINRNKDTNTHIDRNININMDRYNHNKK